MKHLYIIIAATGTKFGGVIRKVGKVKYNHSSIAFDKELNEWYGFARRHHRAVLTGGLVKENIVRYTMNRPRVYVNSMVFEIPVTDEEYARAWQLVEQISGDRSYIYNLFSVLTYPITNGLVTYKAFTCAEFVSMILKMIQQPVSETKLCVYTPDDIGRIIKDYCIFSGNLVDYVGEREVVTDYFQGFSRGDAKESVVNVGRLFARLFYHKKSWGRAVRKVADTEVGNRDDKKLHLKTGEIGKKKKTRKTAGRKKAEGKTAKKYTVYKSVGKKAEDKKAKPDSANKSGVIAG